jgi:hypothetical protein
VKRSKRDRYREILSNPRLRRKFTNKLAQLRGKQIPHRGSGSE